MILADTSVWIDHLRSGSATLSALLAQRKVVTHPFVIGEICLGSLKHRQMVVEQLDALRRVVSATDDEVMALVERHDLHGAGIGWVDAHLIASVLLTPGTCLLTYDKRLGAAGSRLSILYSATN